MSKPTLSTIMNRAHEIARELEGNYSARMSQAMKLAWAEFKGGRKMKIYVTGMEEKGRAAEVLSIEKVKTSTKEYELPSLVEDEGIKFQVEYKLWENYGKTRMYLAGDAAGYIEILADGTSAKAFERGNSRQKGIARGIALLINGNFQA